MAILCGVVEHQGTVVSSSLPGQVVVDCTPEVDILETRLSKGLAVWASHGSSFLIVVVDDRDVFLVAPVVWPWRLREHTVNASLKAQRNSTDDV